MQTQAGGNDTGLIQELSGPLARGAMWIKLVGILNIIQGALGALSIVGIVVAWVPIWMGVLLYQAAGAAQEAQATGSRQAMLRAQEKLRLFFVIMGILFLVGLVLAVLYVLVVFFILGGAIFSEMQQ